MTAARRYARPGAPRSRRRSRSRDRCPARTGSASRSARRRRDRSRRRSAAERGSTGRRREQTACAVRAARSRTASLCRPRTTTRRGRSPRPTHPGAAAAAIAVRAAIVRIDSCVLLTPRSMNVVPSNTASFPSEDTPRLLMKSGQSVLLHLNSTRAAPVTGLIDRTNGWRVVIERGDDRPVVAGERRARGRGSGCECDHRGDRSDQC